MTESTVKKIIFAVMESLLIMNNKGVVHRNINTDNIIASDKKFAAAAKLLDFKFASIVGMDPLFP